MRGILDRGTLTPEEKNMRTWQWTSLALLCGIVLVGPISAGAQSDGTLGQAEMLSDSEKTQFSMLAIEEMRTSVREVSKMLEVSEREKESSRIQCLSKKLTTMRALMEVSESANSSLGDAIKSGDSNRAAHEYRKIAIALSKVRQFRAEAEACAGGTAAQPGATDVQVIDAGMGYDGEDGFSDEIDEFLGDAPPPVSQFE